MCWCQGFFLAFCPRWVQNDIVWIIGEEGRRGGKYVLVCKTCGKLVGGGGGSGGMLPPLRKPWVFIDVYMYHRAV